MAGHPLVRARHLRISCVLTALLIGAAGCANGPSATDPVDSHVRNHNAGFSGAWTTQLPQGRLVLFYARQSGTRISGTITNFGPPIEGLTFPITGTADDATVTLDFIDPAGLSEGATVDLPVAWSFHGAFTSATTVEGDIASSTGISGRIVITEDTGPLPLATNN